MELLFNCHSATAPVQRYILGYIINFLYRHLQIIVTRKLLIVQHNHNGFHEKTDSATFKRLLQTPKNPNIPKIKHVMTLIA